MLRLLTAEFVCADRAKELTLVARLAKNSCNTRRVCRAHVLHSHAQLA
jgi:hypothetical protein